MSSQNAVRLSVVVVTFNSSEAVREALPPLVDQLAPGDELVVVDNASADGTAEAVGALAPEAMLVRNDANYGFAAACNAGAQNASGDLLVLLNPDAVPGPGFCDAIRRPLLEQRGWAAWMGLVTAEGRRAINTSGGVVHFTGISWAGEAGRPASEAPRSPREVGFVSGACMAVPRDTWLRHGGFAADYFMYFEDVDLSLRLRLAGERLGLEPEARVDHHYRFAKGPIKWRLLERNRWATVLRIWPGPLLVLLAPALVATELVLVGTSIARGWGGQKLLATLDTAKALPHLLRARREIQKDRCIRAAEFAAHLTPELTSPYLGRLATLVPLRLVLRLYWRSVLALLRVMRV